MQYGPRLAVFFFSDTLTPETYTLSLHDALPISSRSPRASNRQSSTRAALAENSEKFVPRPSQVAPRGNGCPSWSGIVLIPGDRKSTRLNSSHMSISYAVFCLKKKKKKKDLGSWV